MKNSMKILSCALGLALSGLVLSGHALAEAKPQIPLAQPLSAACTYPGNIIVWDDSNRNVNPPNPSYKYGGSLITSVQYHYSCDTGGVITEGDGATKVSTELSKDAGSILTYSCADPDPDNGIANDFVCSGVIDQAAYEASLVPAVFSETASSNCPGGAYSITSADITGTKFEVKAMNPGQDKGRQNYPILSVACTLDAPAAVPAS